MSDNDLIREAVSWAEAGIPVFPCGPNKAPLTQNGFHDAESDPAKVKALFEFYDNAAMIGGRMGDGIFAVDIDLYKGDEVKAWMKARIEDGTLTETRTHRTRSGGLHLLYQGDVGCTNPAPGVEIKGDGGYVILPGTPGYSVVREGLVDAPETLHELVKYSINATKGSSKAALEGNVLSGADFHNSLTQLAAKLAFEGMDQVGIQEYLLRLLKNSTAATAGHARHHRWLSIVQDKSGELSRMAHSAYVKFNDDAAMEDARESLRLDEHEELAESVFKPAPNYEPPVEEDLPDDQWPFDRGYFADKDHDLASQSFTMYPIFAENETVVLYAEPKTGKTAITLTTALSIACGLDLGSFKVSDAGPTLYYALEGSRAIRLRVAAWRKMKKEEGVELPAQIPLWVEEGHSSFLKEDRRKAEAKKIIAANRYSIKAGKGPLKAVYLDTLTKAMSGGDQNSVEDTSALFDLIGLLREGGVTATIVFVHHKARGGNARGSTNIEAEPDVLLDVSKKGEVVEMRIARARSIEDGGRFRFRLTGVDLGKTEQGHPLAGVYAEPIEQIEGDQDADDFVAGKELGERRAAVVAQGTCTTEDMMKEWHKLGLAPTKKRRGVDAALPWASKEAQAVIAEVAPVGPPTVFGDYLIRSIQDVSKAIARFEVTKIPTNG